MAFNTLEYLKEGKIEFLNRITKSDKEILIKNIRNSNDKEEIIDGFIHKIKDTMPIFAYRLVYDNSNYNYIVDELIENKNVKYLIKMNLYDFLNNGVNQKEYLLNNFEELLTIDNDNILIILEYLIKDFDNNLELIDKIYLHNDLHIRYLFMEKLLRTKKEKIKDIYKDITLYLTSFTNREYEQLTFLPEFMNHEDVSKLAITALEINDQELYDKLKTYLITNYPYNDLAELILIKNQKYIADKNNRNIAIEYLNLFKENADILFETSDKYKYNIYNLYRNYISNNLIEQFKKYIDIFKINNRYDFVLSSIFKYGLSHKLFMYIDKYLAISKDKNCQYLESGSTSNCYKIGDYVFKLNKTKWSREDIICPNIYLIIKNLEEEYVRDKVSNKVLVGIEVQKLLTRKVDNVPQYIFDNYHKELDKLGYELSDTLTNGKCGENAMLLDSYQDADSYNPNVLPDWFKEYPLVSIDRDLVYKKRRYE